MEDARDKGLAGALSELGHRYAQEVANKNILVAQLQEADKEIQDLKAELKEGLANDKVETQSHNTKK